MSRDIFSKIEESRMFARRIGELLRSVPVDAFELSANTSNRLKGAGVKNLGELANKGRKNIIKEFGRPCYKEINEKLSYYGIAFT